MGNLKQKWLSKKSKFLLEKQRYLNIRPFVWLRSNFSTFLRPWHIQEYRCGVCLCVLERSLLQDRFFFFAPKMIENHEKSTFQETLLGDSRKLPGYIGCVLQCIRVSWNEFRTLNNSEKKWWNFEIKKWSKIMIFWLFRASLGGCRKRRGYA